MAEYTTIVVGTDGSETSYRAVERAAALARDEDALLIIASAFTPPKSDEIDYAHDVLGDDAAYLMRLGPAEDALRDAYRRAVAVGADKIDTIAYGGKPTDVLLQIIHEREADLLVIGNKGLNTLAGRLIGSVPLDILRHCPIDVLVAHTT